jgi:hypothetical protein
LPKQFPKPPLIAVFHPEQVGHPGTAHRLIGLLRRSPDPFLQFIPPGSSLEAGTVFAASVEDLKPDHAHQNFVKLRGRLDALFAALGDIHADRARSYLPHLEALSAQAP